MHSYRWIVHLFLGILTVFRNKKIINEFFKLANVYKLYIVLYLCNNNFLVTKYVFCRELNKIPYGVTFGYYGAQLA